MNQSTVLNESKASGQKVDEVVDEVVAEEKVRIEKAL